MVNHHFLLKYALGLHRFRHIRLNHRCHRLQKNLFQLCLMLQYRRHRLNYLHSLDLGQWNFLS
jgi:hypothetical protein